MADALRRTREHMLLIDDLVERIAHARFVKTDVSRRRAEHGDPLARGGVLQRFGKRLRRPSGRDKVRLHAVHREPPRRMFPHCGKFMVRKTAYVHLFLHHAIKKDVHAVGRRKSEPIVIAEPFKERVERERHDAPDNAGQGREPAGKERFAHPSDMIGRADDGDPRPARKGALPRLAQQPLAAHFADDGGERRLHLTGDASEFGERTAARLRARRSGFGEQRRGRLRRTSARNKPLRDVLRRSFRHQKNERVPCRGIPCRIRNALLCTRRDDGEGARDAAMRQGNARKFRRRDGGSHARDDAAGGARPCERGKFLPAPSEYKGIAPLETHGERVFVCAADEQGVDLLLRHGVRPRPFSDGNGFAMRGNEGQERLVQQRIVDDAVGAAQELRAPDGDEPLAAARAHQNDAVHTNSSARRSAAPSPKGMLRMTPSFCA